MYMAYGHPSHDPPTLVLIGDLQNFLLFLCLLNFNKNSMYFCFVSRALGMYSDLLFRYGNTKRVGQYSIFARKPAKMLYCRKKPIPGSKNAVLSQQNSKKAPLEPVRPPGDQTPQRLGQYHVFCSFGQKTLGQHSFLQNEEKTLYCPNLLGVWSPGGLTGSKGVFLGFCLDSVFGQCSMFAACDWFFATVQHFCWLYCKNTVSSQSFRGSH